VVDPEKIRILIELMSEHDLAEISFRSGDEEVVLKRPTTMPLPHPPGYFSPYPPPPPAPVAAPPPAAPPPGAAPAAPPVAAPTEEDLIPIKSPMVGTFYAARDPQSPSFVTVGSTVTPETVVCLVEAMKVFNEIKAEVSGTVARILVKNEDPVEFGQPMFLVKPH
jgi:acetyl-CoA carboxylase biotin carboxyl carrier protein